jgi:hypothetical protein
VPPSQSQNSNIHVDEMKFGSFKTPFRKKKQSWADIDEEDKAKEARSAPPFFRCECS